MAKSSLNVCQCMINLLNETFYIVQKNGAQHQRQFGAHVITTRLAIRF